MARWELLTDEVARSTWDEALLKFDDYTPFQTYAWGEYRRGLGWRTDPHNKSERGRQNHQLHGRPDTAGYFPITSCSPGYD